MYTKIMMKKWYQDWRSWVTIVLLFFVPTFLIGIIVMWAAAPWGKKAKWWVTGVGIGLPLLGIIIAFFLVTLSPKKQINTANDAIKKANVQEISQQGNRFCLAEGRCATGIQELKQKGYLNPSLNVDSVGDVQLNGVKDCIVQATLSTNEIFSIKCFPVKSP